MINGITYGKGCSFLKQLYFQVGDEKFSEATKIYFKRHQWKNTVLTDFLTALHDACEGDHSLSHVKDWSNEFLNTKGVNTIEAERTPTGIKITQHRGEFSQGL